MDDWIAFERKNKALSRHLHRRCMTNSACQTGNCPTRRCCEVSTNTRGARSSIQLAHDRPSRRLRSAILKRGAGIFGVVSADFG